MKLLGSAVQYCHLSFQFLSNICKKKNPILRCYFDEFINIYTDQNYNTDLKPCTNRQKKN